MELADVEDAARVGLRGVRRVRADIGGERGGGGGGERGVGGDARLEPLLERELEEEDVVARRAAGAERRLERGERHLAQRHPAAAEHVEEGRLRRQREEQRLTHLAEARRPPDAVDILLWLLRQVVLHDPVDPAQVEAARRHVGAQQHAGARRAERAERRGAPLLAHPPVEAVQPRPHQRAIALDLTHRQPRAAAVAAAVAVVAVVVAVVAVGLALAGGGVGGAERRQRRARE